MTGNDTTRQKLDALGQPIPNLEPTDVLRVALAAVAHRDPKAARKFRRALEAVADEWQQTAGSNVYNIRDGRRPKDAHPANVWARTMARAMQDALRPRSDFDQ